MRWPYQDSWRNNPSGADQVVLFYGLPPIFLKVIPLIVDIALRIFTKKTLKLVLGLTIIVAVVLYFGVLSWSTFNSYLEKAYAAMPFAIQYAAILFTILPLGLGFLIGLYFRWDQVLARAIRWCKMKSMKRAKTSENTFPPGPTYWIRFTLGIAAGLICGVLGLGLEGIVMGMGCVYSVLSGHPFCVQYPFEYWRTRKSILYNGTGNIHRHLVHCVESR